MPETFVYRARDLTGRLVRGQLEAESEARAVALLREQNYVVVDLQAAPAGAKIGFGHAVLRERPVGARSLAVFCRQLATLIEAGVPLLSALVTLGEQTEDRVLRRAVAGVAEHLRGGRGLAEALRFYPRVFPPLMTNMVEAGEVGGVLDRVLERLALHFEKEHALASKIKSAVTYPAVVISVAVLTLLVMVTFVLPAFTDMLYALDVPMPLPTRLVIALSEGLRMYWYLLPVVVAGLFVALRVAYTSPRGRKHWDRLVLRLPIFGKLVHKTIIARFCRTLGTLLRGGVPILRALDVVRAVAGNTLVVQAVEEAAVNVRAGASLAEPMARSGVFPPLVTQMITVGEETGALDTMLERVAAFYESEVETLVARLASLIEPVLIVGLGAIVGFIVIAILLPYFQMLGSL